MSDAFENSIQQLNLEGVELQIAALSRRGDGAPTLFLHGFGSTKEDYADFTRLSAFDGRPFLAYDAPGCESACKIGSDAHLLKLGPTSHRSAALATDRALRVRTFGA